MERERLVAACGLYCGACEMYRAINDNDQERKNSILKAFSSNGNKFSEEDLACEGCLGGEKLLPFCRNCKIKSCDKHEPGKQWCSPDCEDFPCSLLTGFTKDGFVHHEEVIGNLLRLHKLGIAKYAEEEEKRWLCPECNAPMAWYRQKCDKCGEPRSKELYSP